MPNLAETVKNERPFVDVVVEGAVAALWLNRPENRNALSRAMMSALGAALETLSGRKDLRVIVLAARGPVFCSGHDLKEMTAHRADADAGRGFFQATMAQCSALMQSLLAHPLPIIAAVDGMASAAGCQLVASCDLAVAGERARFCTPGVNIGLFCSTPMVALSRNLPRKQAMEMLLTGDVFNADDALRFGLVNAVAQQDAVAEATALADKIAGKSNAAIAYGKRAFYQQTTMNLPDAYAHASAVMVENMLEAQAREGVEAFLQKRPPNWSE